MSVDIKKCRDFFFVFVNSSRPGQDGRHFVDDMVRCILVNCILIIISLKFILKGPIDNNLALV